MPRVQTLRFLDAFVQDVRNQRVQIWGSSETPARLRDQCLTSVMFSYTLSLLVEFQKTTQKFVSFAFWWPASSAFQCCNMWHCMAVVSTLAWVAGSAELFSSCVFNLNNPWTCAGLPQGHPVLLCMGENKGKTNMVNVIKVADYRWSSESGIKSVPEAVVF